MAYRILVVDDKEPALRLTATVLGLDPRFQVLLARDGDEAVDAAVRERPDLILLDINMPKRDGYQVCAELKSRPDTRAIKIVMVTAMAQEADRQRALELGAEAYITKPFSPARLKQTVETQLGVA